MCGTPEYAPPEMLVRSPEYTKAVDIWSLGVLAFEFLTGVCECPGPLGLSSMVKTAKTWPGRMSSFSTTGPKSNHNRWAKF